MVWNDCKRLKTLLKVNGLDFDRNFFFEVAQCQKIQHVFSANTGKTLILSTKPKHNQPGQPLDSEKCFTLRKPLKLFQREIFKPSVCRNEPKNERIGLRTQNAWFCQKSIGA